ncbi:hypothetical protein HDU99_004372, partial [Rhizoclosmatium hyalinum]
LEIANDYIPIANCPKWCQSTPTCVGADYSYGKGGLCTLQSSMKGGKWIDYSATIFLPSGTGVIDGVDYPGNDIGDSAALNGEDCR